MKIARDYNGTGRRVLIIVQNLPVPFDRRVWQEACALSDAGYTVSVICPKSKEFRTSYEYINGVHIYRHPLPLEAEGALGYALEYSISLFWEWLLAWRVLFAQGFDVIHACNPPDTIFLIAGFFKFIFGKKFLFDHHDINPELYEAKFGKRDLFYKAMVLLERLMFATADISIATNNSYRDIALTRGRMQSSKVFVVRSGPSLDRIKIVPAVPAHRNGRQFLVGYVGVIGQQEGIPYLIKAAAYILHVLKREDIHFTVIGSGPALDAMKLLAAQKKVEDVITFTGRVDDKTLLEILNTADVCVNPDEVCAMNDKSTMNKIMEYMALGKPIVQFDVTEGRFSAGNASLYAKANNAQDFALQIITLLDDPVLRVRMGSEGYRRIEQELAWNYEAPKLLAAYEAVFALPDARKKFGWVYNRLHAMSMGEIVYRIRETGKRKWDKYYLSLFKCHSRLRGNDIAGIKEFIQKIAVLNLPSAIQQNWRQHYEQVKSGHYTILGACWPGDISGRKWHLDPISGQYWPDSRFCFDIVYRHAPGMGDVKYACELSRLQYLQSLAILAFKEADTTMALFCLVEIESWIDHNPPGSGIHWASGIELSLRTVSIILVATLLTKYITPALSLKIIDSLSMHGRWIERYRSAHSSANNHLIAEALGLLMIATACVSLPESQHWKKTGWDILCKEIQKQILDDGIGAERSMAYMQFSIDIFSLGLWLAQVNHMTIPDYYASRLALAEEALSWFKDESENYPQIGDNDNGIVTDPWLRELFCAVKSLASPDGVRTFDKGGYSIARFKAQERAIMLGIDHGDLGYLSIAAHGHADALALWLHIGDQPVLVDAGTYLYHSGGPWRDYFRSTRAHNTLTIENMDSSTMAGPFNWSHKAKAALNSSESTPKGWTLAASHDGYCKKFGAKHIRSLQVVFEEGCNVTDRLTGDKPQAVEIRFLLHPALSAVQKNDEIDILKGSFVLLRMRHESPLAARLGTPGTPQSGWYSESFGKKAPATQIIFHGTLSPQQAAITRLLWKL